MIPALFIAHGAPLLAIEDNVYTQFLNSLGRALPTPKAVVLFSAHWESSTQLVSDVTGAYSTIYDFRGFPEALYQIQYPALGEATVTRQIAHLFDEHGVKYATDAARGLDHGAWVVLRLLFPDAQIPVIAMSVDPDLTPEQQYLVGKALSSLRAENVLIIGSGGTVHNLRALKMQGNGGQVDPWATEFDTWLANCLADWDVDALFRYDTLAPSAQLAVPPHGNEHFVPLFYAMGAADDRKQAQLLHRSYRYGNLSHSVWQFG